MQPLITVFTPTYNRKHTLHRTYESLKNQTRKNFIWLIIDDGSSDGTVELVKVWEQADNGFKIQYVYKSNGGMHTAHNAAYNLITTELNVCIDSDDKLTENAIELIENSWHKRDKTKEVAGIIAYDCDYQHNRIGPEFPDVEYSNLNDLEHKYKCWGDKKLILRTDVVHQYPAYPEYPEERLVPLSYLYIQIDHDYDYVLLPDSICMVEYQANGSSATINRQYFQSPNGFVELRKMAMKCSKYTSHKLKAVVHYVAESIIAHKKHIIADSPMPVVTLLAYPFGIALLIYLRYKRKNGVKG